VWLQHIKTNEYGYILKKHINTDNIDITAGLRQGDRLLPILYSLFLNPLLKWTQATAMDAYMIGNKKFSGGAYLMACC